MKASRGTLGTLGHALHVNQKLPPANDHRVRHGGGMMIACKCVVGNLSSNLVRRPALSFKRAPP
jgi:hypothetical protein